MGDSIENLWALSWRPGDCVLHAAPLVDVLRKNSSVYLAGGESMVLCGVHKSLEEALSYRRYLRHLRAELKKEVVNEEAGESKEGWSAGREGDGEAEEEVGIGA